MSVYVCGFFGIIKKIRIFGVKRFFSECYIISVVNDAELLFGNSEKIAGDHNPEYGDNH